MSRPRRGPPPAPVDALAEAVFRDAQGIAGELSDVLKALAGYDMSQIYAVLWRKPDDYRPGTSLKFQWLEDVPAPLDMQEICQLLKSKYGGGDYRISIHADKLLRKQVEVTIYGPPVKLGAIPAPANDGMKPTDLLALIMNQQAESRRESAEQQRFFMEQQSARDARMMQTIGIIVPVVAPLLLGGREKLSDMIALLKADQPSSNLKDTVETFTALKLLFQPEGGTGGGGEFNPDDIVGSIGRLAGPVLAAAGRAFNGRGAAPPAAEAEAEAAGDGLLHLPAPEPELRFNPPPRAGAVIAAGDGTGSPLLDLVKPHVAYFFNAHLDPGLAAEAIADIMQRADVAEEDVSGLVAAFSLSPDWLADLAAQGLDLRSDPEWANSFLRELVALWTDSDRDGDHSPGPGGSAPDPKDDAGAGAPGVKVNGHSRPGA